VFLEMVKDMPRGRQESLARLLVPLLVVTLALLGVAVVRMADDARVDGDLQRQIVQQAEAAGVLFLDERGPLIPRAGERDEPAIVDGRRVDVLITIDGDVATLRVPPTDG
jgi:hypothetical protein